MSDNSGSEHDGGAYLEQSFNVRTVRTDQPELPDTIVGDAFTLANELMSRQSGKDGR